MEGYRLYCNRVLVFWRVLHHRGPILSTGRRQRCYRHNRNGETICLSIQIPMKTPMSFSRPRGRSRYRLRHLPRCKTLILISSSLPSYGQSTALETWKADIDPSVFRTQSETVPRVWSTRSDLKKYLASCQDHGGFNHSWELVGHFVTFPRKLRLENIP